MAPPPQRVPQPEASEEEEEEDKANHMAPPSATQNPPPPPPNHEESESDEGEEEETDDEAPQPESVPKLEAKGNGVKPPPSSDDKKPLHRSWSKDDDVRILEVLAAHRREHGKLPQPEDLEASLAGNLDNSVYGRKELTAKLKSLKATYTRTVNKGDLPSKDTGRRIFDLSKEVWGSAVRPENGPSNGTVSTTQFGELCKMYPYLGEEIKALERTQPGLFKREFSLIDSEKARTMDQKVKKQRVLQMKLEIRFHDVVKEVTKTLMDLME